MENTPISLYNGNKDNTGTKATVGDAFAIIKSDKLSKQITAIANTTDDKIRGALKGKLPAVTWSGSFKKRNSKFENGQFVFLEQYSHLICLDFDKLSIEALNKFREQLSKDAYVFAFFYSPSGKGLKVLIKLNNGPELHKEAFTQLAAYFATQYNIAADESGKDICRLCYLSWDISLFINEDSVPFPLSRAVVEPISFTGGLDAEFERIKAFTSNKVPYVENLYNKHLSTFIINCKEAGIERNDTHRYCEYAYRDYIDHHPTKALERIITTVYDNTRYIFGKYRKQSSVQKTTVVTTYKQKHIPTTNETPQYNEATLFWYVTTKTDKETGEIKEEHKFDHDGLTWFMANNGFRKIRLGEKGYQFVRINGNLLEALEPDELNKFIVDYLQQNISANKDGVYGRDEINDDLQPVRRMYMRGIKNYSNPAVYSALPAVQPKFLRDTQTHTYLYFENGFVEITADSIKLKPYTELTNHIWAKQKKQFNINIVDKEEMEKSDAFRFISAAIIGEGIDDNDPKRLLSMLTTIGYQVDSYKDPTNAKCVIYGDKEINRTGQESHGGSGKTLMAHMIGKLVNACVLDGKAFRFEDPYPFETLKPDHKMLVFNDVQKKFSFEQLFHKITEDFEYRKKYIDAIIIPFEDSPKPLVITNFTVAGEGSSFRRRQQFIEFSNYFTDEYTPKDEFKRRFFYDWDDAEWNRFYNVFFYAVQKFKKHGLVSFPATNLKLNKLIQAAGESFIDWMDDKVMMVDHNNPLYYNTKLDRAEVFSMFRDECADYRKMENSNTFTGWVKMWCEVRGYEINKHKNYGHDKSGGKYFWTITKKEEPKKQ